MFTSLSVVVVKPVPRKITVVPTGPEVGEMEVTVMWMVDAIDDGT